MREISFCLILCSHAFGATTESLLLTQTAVPTPPNCALTLGSFAITSFDDPSVQKLISKEIEPSIYLASGIVEPQEISLSLKLTKFLKALQNEPDSKTLITPSFEGIQTPGFDGVYFGKQRAVLSLKTVTPSVPTPESLTRGLRNALDKAFKSRKSARDLAVWERVFDIKAVGFSGIPELESKNLDRIQALNNYQQLFDVKREHKTPFIVAVDFGDAEQSLYPLISERRHVPRFGPSVKTIRLGESPYLLPLPEMRMSMKNGDKIIIFRGQVVTVIPHQGGPYYYNLEGQALVADLAHE